MATFAYSGRTRGGETISGERVAESSDAAVAALRREQVFVTRINPSKAKAAEATAASRVRGGKTGKKTTAKNLAVFTRQFSVMIDAGLPLVQCLDILGNQEADKNFSAVIQSTRSASEEVHLEVRPDDWEKPWSEQRMRITDVRVSQGGVDLYHAELDHHEATSTAAARTDPDGVDEPVPPSGGACDAELPRSIRMRVPHTEEDVIFQYKEAKWNPPLVPAAFVQPVPGGVTKRFVNCDAGR